MTRHLDVQRAGVNPTLGSKFRPATVLAEGIRVLPDSEVTHLMSIMSYTNPRGVLSRYFAAKKALQEFGATVELVQVHNSAIRIAARLEFLTDHLRLNDELYSLVVGMGFNLTLRHTTKEHAYVLTESRYQSTSEFSSVAQVAEDLFRLAKMLEPYAFPLPDNLVHLPARTGTSGPVSTALDDRRVALSTS